ncbi:MAG: MmgE/PrpD family protein [Chloroflexi bacterium]|nr:MmgE/PrpD family protein [Chloroflexota bacterium]
MATVPYTTLNPLPTTTQARQVAQWVHELKLEALPQEVVTQTKYRTLDTIGTTLGGLDQDASLVIRKMVRDMRGRQQATVWGDGVKVPVKEAAHANGISACVLDFDDGHAGCGSHPSSVIVPTALTVGEWQHCSGADYLAAMAAGWEIMVRASRLLIEQSKGAQFAHTTGCSGAHGSAAAAARLMGLGDRATANALGIAMDYAPQATWQAIPVQGQMVKESIGWASLVGVSSAVMASYGFTGAYTMYDDGSPVTRQLLRSLGNEWEMARGYFKRYPFCRWTHASIASLTDIMKQHNLKAGDIVRVEAGVGPDAATLSSKRPPSVEALQYSFPIALGAVLAYGEASIRQGNNAALQDPRLLAQADKVSVKVDSWAASLPASRYPGVLTVTTRTGQTFTMRRETAPGDVEEHLSWTEVEAKFYDNAAVSLSKGTAQKVYDKVMSLERLADVSELVTLLARREKE